MAERFSAEPGGVADALATMTPARTGDAAGRAPASVLRAALYGWAFNPGRADCSALCAFWILSYRVQCSLTLSDGAFMARAG